MANPTNSAQDIYPLVSEAAGKSPDAAAPKMESKPDNGTCAGCGKEVAPTRHPSGTGWMRPTSLCARCDYLHWRNEWQEADRQAQFDRALTAADIPDRALNDALREEVNLLHTLDRLCGIPPGERRDITSVYLYGDVGTGKSVQGALALHTYLTRWVPKGPHMTDEGKRFARVRYCNPERLLERYKASFDGGPKVDADALITCDLLVLDDIGVESGKESGSDWARSQLYNIINGRYEQRKLTIFTSNYALTRAEAEAWSTADKKRDYIEQYYNYSQRTVSRIFQMCGGTAGKLQTIHLKHNWRKPRGRQ